MPEGDVSQGLATIHSLTCEDIFHGVGAIGNGESHLRIPIFGDVVGQRRVLQ